jgi:adenosylmethionine-8-amino-7-oxononanoate aminotransferase
MGHTMTDLESLAARHLWMHFSRMGGFETEAVPIIERGEGCYLFDSNGKRYLDGLSGLFVVQAGHGRTELAQAGAEQAERLAYFPIWNYANPPAIKLASRLAEAAPGDLNRVFFTTSGSEAVETAWKLARQYFNEIGEPGRYKVISRNIAYHGTTLGALAITGIPAIRAPFEPLTPGARHVPNTDTYRPWIDAPDEETFGRLCADAIENMILMEGPETVAAVVLEPIQNAGGCFVPPIGYWQRVREICDRYGVLLISDEVICAYGRLGHLFGCDRFGYVPDIITTAKGLTSGYSPMGALIASDRIMEPFLKDKASFLHGITFAGHPVSCAVANANLDLFEREQLCANVLANETALEQTLRKLEDLPIVGNIRGAGYFWAIELVKDRATKAEFSAQESEDLLRGFLSRRLYEEGLICRTDDRGEPVMQFAPPLIAKQTEFDEIERIVRKVLTEAVARLGI